ncbi:unnamed protein product [Lactuca virosa]|uniref:Protein kinase domain-containing protein n=1 Tax=Lactuca virosa TaxID=75947 RepID=A0AAU9PHC4_9ASTR|nr:unnamed protein product [Lactuca virosa]
MISDFGLSKIGPTNQSTSYVDASVKGTFGYLDPEYFYTRRLTRKTDVYAFGVILFELLTGRLAVDESNAEENISLVRWAQKCVKERKFDQMVDSNIQGTVLSKCLRGFAKIAYRCLLSVLKERPTMAEVVITLQDLLELQRRHDNSAEAPGITVFTWKIHKFLASTTKQNSDRNGTSSSKSLEMNMNQCSSTNKDGSDQVGVPCQHEESVVTDLKRFRYLDLRRATKNFGNGRNMKGMCFVQVYKGWIDKRTYSPSKANTGLPISIKTVDRRIYLPNLAWSELDLEMLKEFRHPNLEKLIGYCLKGKKLLLVYEFMPKGNFEDHLYTGTLFTLPLVAKVKIAVGIARGIVFLHKSQDLLGGRVFGESRLHRDKILLDEDYTVKLANYDVTKLVHGGYPWGVAFYELGIRDDYPGFKRGEPQSNFLGFTMAFIEVITGKTISNGREFQKMDDLFMKYGKMSLVHIAQSCFDICNEVDSESNMLKILEQYIPQNKEFATELLRARYCDDWLYPENSPEWHKYMKELW